MKFFEQQVPLLLLICILVLLSVFLKEESFIVGIYIALGIVVILFFITTLGVWQKVANRLVLIELKQDTLHVQQQHYGNLVDLNISLKQLGISVDVATENKSGWKTFEIEISDKSNKDLSIIAELDIYEIGPILESIHSNKLKKLNKTETEILELYNRSGSRPMNIKKWGIILALGTAAVYLYMNKETTLQLLEDFKVKPGLEIGAWHSDADGFPYYFQLRVDSTWEENYFDKTGRWKWIPADTINNAPPNLHIFIAEGSFHEFVVRELTNTRFILENTSNQKVYTFNRLKGGSFSKPNVTQRFTHFMNQSTLLPPDQLIFSAWLRELDVKDEGLRPHQIFIQSDTLFAGLLTNQQQTKWLIIGVDDFSQKKLFLTELGNASDCENSFAVITEGSKAFIKQEESCKTGKSSIKVKIYQVSTAGIQEVAE